jgi:hypothetical protein
MNFSTAWFDTERYSGNADLKTFYRSFGLDGLEVIYGGEDKDNLIAAEDVIGVHLRYFTAWMDLWKGNTKRLLEEYGDYGEIERFYGGRTSAALTEAFRHNLKFAASMSPEYLVFHVSDCLLSEAMLRRFYYSEEAVVDAAIELVNTIGEYIEGSPLLLFENLWYSGLTMLAPRLAARLLEETHYPHTGVMLDTGHLLNTNTSLRTIDEGVDYIHSVLDQYSDLSFIKGVHLHQSLSGAYSEALMKSWVPDEGSYSERRLAVLPHIFQIDTHQPFASERVSALLDRIQPEYLVLEQISSSRDEHERNLKEQMRYL